MVHTVNASRTLKGKLNEGVYAKDISLWIIGKIGSDGANYMAVEFHGDTIRELSVESRMTLTNMVVEMGAKTGLVPVDEKTVEWLKNTVGHAVEIEFNRYIAAGDLSKAIDRIERDQAASDAAGGFLGMNL